MKQLQALIHEAFLFKNELGGRPVGVGTVGEVTEAEGSGFLAEEGEVGKVEATNKEAGRSPLPFRRRTTQAGYVAGHISQKDVAVDVGKDNVVRVTPGQ